MANGAFNFKDSNGNIVSFISGSGSDIIMSGGTLNLSSMTGLTLGNLTMEGTVETASFAPNYLLTSSFETYTGITDTIIGSLQTSTSSLNSFTSSAESRLGSIEGVSGSYATTGSNTFNGNLTVTGYIDVQELRTTYISSSILYRSGSTKFGDELTDNHEFTGSLLVSGSNHEIIGNFTFSKTDDARIYIKDTGDNSTLVLRADATNEIYTDTADDLQIYTSGNQNKQIYLKQLNGFVGINTTNPQSKLDVRSSGLDTDVFSIYGTTNSAKMFDFRDDSAAGVSAAMFRMYNSSGTETVRLFPGTAISHHSWILPTGNFGVGTSAPVYKLTVDGVGSEGNMGIERDTVGTDTVIGALNFTNNNGGTVYGRVRGGRNSNGDGYVSLGTGVGDNLYAIEGGNIGLGTATPSSLLHLSGNAPNIYFDDTTTTGTRKRFQIIVGDVGTTQSALLGFNNTSGTSLLDVLVVNENGRVGIGINAPTTDFHISSSSSQIVRITTSGALSGGYYDAFQMLAPNQTGGGLSLNIGKAESTRNLAKMVYFHNSDGSTSNRLGFGFYDVDSLFNILAGGTTGIGVTDATSRLEIKPAPSASTMSTLGISSNSAINIRIPNAVGDVGQIVFTNEAAPTYGYGSIGMVMTSGSGVGLADFIISTKSVGTDAASIERFRVNSSGFVGLGTISPITKLSLGGYNGARLAYINGTSNTFNDSGITVPSSNTSNAGIGGGIDLTNNTYSVGAYSPIISFSSLSSSSSYNNSYAGIWGVMTGPGVDSNWVTGDLVLGTASGAGIVEKLRIKASNDIIMHQYVYNSVDGFSLSSGGLMRVGINANDTGTEIFLINNRTSGGAVSLIQYRTSGTVEGSIIGDSNGLSISNVSDYRKKTDIRDLSGSLNIINNLQPKLFKFKDGFGKPTDKDFVGFIAHEIQSVLPDSVVGVKDAVYTQEDINKGVVGYNVGDPRYQTVSYTSNEIITHLVGSIKEQQTIIDDLKLRLEQLENN